MMNMVTIFIPWLITKIKSMMVILIIMHKKDEDYEEYGYDSHPLAYNQDEEYDGHPYFPGLHD